MKLPCVSEKDLLNPEMKTIKWKRSLPQKRALGLGALICIQTIDANCKSFLSTH